MSLLGIRCSLSIRLFHREASHAREKSDQFFDLLKRGCAGVLDSNLIRLNKTKSNVCMVIGDSIRNGNTVY